MTTSTRITCLAGSLAALDIHVMGGEIIRLAPGASLTDVCCPEHEFRVVEAPEDVLPTSYIKAPTEHLSFGDVLSGLHEGKAYQRAGWNGKGIYIALQTPDEHSKMTQPYIYIVTTGLVSADPTKPKGVVPWLASQTDMLAQDWELCINR